MMLEKLRQEVFESLLELPKNRLVTMHSGTVSGRDPETGYIVIKPTGFRYDRLTPSDLLVMDSSGKILEGTLRPSSDTETHLYLYRASTGYLWHCPHPFSLCMHFCCAGQADPGRGDLVGAAWWRDSDWGLCCCGWRRHRLRDHYEDREMLSNRHAKSRRLHDRLNCLAGYHRRRRSRRHCKNCSFCHAAWRSNRFNPTADRRISEYLPHALRTK